MADFQAKICEKFNIKSLTDNQSKSIMAIIDGKDVFVGTKTGSVFTASLAPLEFGLPVILELGKVLGLLCCWCVG
jgi:superfamily II DNA/RNA helicase